MAKPNIALNDHRLDLITSAASIAVGVRGAARTELRAKTTAIVPIMIRSAQKEDLDAIEKAMKPRVKEKRAVIRSTRCRIPLMMFAHDQTARITHESVTSTSSRRLLSIPSRNLIPVAPLTHLRARVKPTGL